MHCSGGGRSIPPAACNQWSYFNTWKEPRLPPGGVPAKHRNVRFEIPAAACDRAARVFGFFIGRIHLETEPDAVSRGFPVGRQWDGSPRSRRPGNGPGRLGRRPTFQIHPFSFARGITVIHRIVNPRNLGSNPSGRASPNPDSPKHRSDAAVSQTAEAGASPAGETFFQPDIGRGV